MIRIFKFKKNDLNPSGGKQLEYSISDVQEFFCFTKAEETIEFRFVAADSNSPINGFKFKSTFKLSPARGDYKCYGNVDGSVNLKSFFLEKLHLTIEQNGDDAYGLKKIGESCYLLAYFPQNIAFGEVAQFFYGQNTYVEIPSTNITYVKKDLPLQVIYFGAPGTGKSHRIKQECKKHEHYRITFHPDTDYSSFVGSYKPITHSEKVYTNMGDKAIALKDDNGKPITTNKITYKYVYQAFLNAYIAAWKELQNEEPKPVFLVIEEINRGNCAQIFGDIFQLLDRNDAGYSDYPIVTDNDLKKELEAEFAGLTVAHADAINSLYEEGDVVGKVIDGSRLLLPNNLYIWATMNTSDQSLFPIDSAFKRRWEWKYVKIADSGKGYVISVNGNEYDWWQFVSKINNIIGSEIEQEDKKLGYFFAKTSKNADGRYIVSADTFLSKVIFFLYNDVFKDFGFEYDFFKDKDGNIMLFADYFNEYGDTDQDKVETFIQNLGLTPINGDTDDANGEIDPPFDGMRVNGQSIRTITGAMIEILKVAAENNTFAEIQEAIKECFPNEEVYDIVKEIENPDTYEKENQWNKTILTANDNISFVVSNQWYRENLPQVKELAEYYSVPFDLDYEIIDFDGEEHKLVVKWPDGYTISVPSKQTTYIKALTRIGLDRAAQALEKYFRLNDVPVISKTPSPKVTGTMYKYQKVGDWYILLGIDSYGRNIRQISKVFDLDLEVTGE